MALLCVSRHEWCVIDVCSQVWANMDPSANWILSDRADFNLIYGNAIEQTAMLYTVYDLESMSPQKGNLLKFASRILCVCVSFFFFFCSVYPGWWLSCRRS